MIIERIKALNMPAGQFVVIGSGVMDALGLRAANDIDLVVTPEYFAKLKQTDGWTVAEKHGEEVLTRQGEALHGELDLEVWLSWGSPNGQPNFSELYDNGITVAGIRFASPAFVRDWKIAHHRSKDMADIALLTEYLAQD